MEKYEPLEIEIIEFDEKDIIVASGVGLLNEGVPFP